MIKNKNRFYEKLYCCIAKYLPESSELSIAGKIRFYLASKIIKNIGENVNVERGATFTSRVEIKKNSGIGINCRLMGDIRIGENVMMGPDVAMYSFNHEHKKIDIPMIKQGYTVSRPIKIEDNVWIGTKVVILPGVTIGQGSIVGAGSIVTKDVPPFSIVSGNPARVIKIRPQNK